MPTVRLQRPQRRPLVPVLALAAATLWLITTLALADQAQARRWHACHAPGRHQWLGRRGRCAARDRQARRGRPRGATELSRSAHQSARAAAPGAPSNLAANAGDTTVSLHWSASSGVVSGYRVYRDGRQVAQTGQLSFVDSGRTDGTTYRYSVTAYNARAVSGSSNVVYATPAAVTPAPPVPPPPPPSPGPGPSGGGQTWTCGWGAFSDALSAFAVPSACWRPFADSSWLNTPLPSNPKLLSNSASLVANMMSPSTGNGDGTVRGLHPIPSPGNDYDHPYFFSSASDPLYTISCVRNCNLAGQNVNGDSVRIPCGAAPADGGDHHLAVIDQAAGYEWDFWDVQTDLSSCAGGTLRVGLAGRASMSADGSGSCADSVCTALTAGIIREPELASGQIDHALFMVSHTCNGTTVYPGWTPNTCGNPNGTAPAVGQWFKLDLTPAQIQALSGVSDWQKTILTTLSTYGMFVGDQGSNGAFELQTDSPSTYAGTVNPWLAWATAEQAQPSNNISFSGGTLSLDLGAGLPSGFWAAHLEAIDPCVIQRTC